MSIGLAALMVGCSTVEPGAGGGSVERGLDGTIAHYIEIESNPPGVRIEADGEDVGVTPVRVKVFGDRDGTFHNFGRFEYVIRAIPNGPGQHLQSKVYRTGGYFTSEDRIPRRIFFEMQLTPGLHLDNLNP